MTDDATAPPLRQSTPAEDRARRKAALARFVRSSLLEHDCSLALLSHALGVSAALVSRMLDHEDDSKHLIAADIEALPPVVRRAVVGRLAESLGCVLGDMPPAEGFSTDLGLLSRVVKETAEVATKHADALQDQHIDPVEAEMIMREATEAIGALQTLHRRCSQAVRERGSPLRSVKF